MSRRAPLRTLFDDDRDLVASCLLILERGMRRLGINPAEKMTRMAARTRPNAPQAIAARARLRAKAQPQAPAAARPRAGTRRPYAPHFTPAQLAEIEALHRAGHTQPQIARALGCTQSAIAKRLAALRSR